MEKNYDKKNGSQQVMANTNEQPSLYMENKLYFSPIEVARIFNVTRMTIYRLLKSQKLSYIRIRDCLRIKRSDIEEYIQKHEVKRKKDRYERALENK